MLSHKMYVQYFGDNDTGRDYVMSCYFVFEPFELALNDLHTYFSQKVFAAIDEIRKSILVGAEYRIMLAFNYLDETDNGFGFVINKYGTNFTDIANSVIEKLIEHGNDYRARNSNIDCINCFLAKMLLFGGLVITVANLKDVPVGVECPGRDLKWAKLVRSHQIVRMAVKDGDITIDPQWDKEGFVKL